MGIFTTSASNLPLADARSLVDRAAEAVAKSEAGLEQAQRDAADVTARVRASDPDGNALEALVAERLKKAARVESAQARLETAREILVQKKADAIQAEARELRAKRDAIRAEVTQRGAALTNEVRQLKRKLDSETLALNALKAQGDDLSRSLAGLGVEPPQPYYKEDLFGSIWSIRHPNEGLLRVAQSIVEGLESDEARAKIEAVRASRGR